MSIRMLSALVAAAGLAGAAVAHAQPVYDESPTVGEVVVTAPYGGERELKSEPVSFADLDLSTHDGAYTLMGRISAAAKRVCAPEPTIPGSLQDQSDYHHCYTSAMSRAVDDVNEPTLEDVYLDRISYGG